MSKHVKVGCLTALAIILLLDAAVVAIVVAITKLVWRAL